MDNELLISKKAKALKWMIQINHQQQWRIEKKLTAVRQRYLSFQQRFEQITELIDQNQSSLSEHLRPGGSINIELIQQLSQFIDQKLKEAANIQHGLMQQKRQLETIEASLHKHLQKDKLLNEKLTLELNDCKQALLNELDDSTYDLVLNRWQRES